MQAAPPRLLRVSRDESGAYAVVFRIGRGEGEIGIDLPATVREEDLLALARHHLHQLLYESAAATAAWSLPEGRAEALASKDKARHGA